mmetsp:Transcript_1145/g.1484  ORF Transcript_1145/g.1484 Transcript_1145/m.1484 type:complete len:788 (-) Transcript_1145:543-2906(-)
MSNSGGSRDPSVSLSSAPLNMNMQQKLANAAGILLTAAGDLLETDRIRPETFDALFGNDSLGTLHPRALTGKAILKRFKSLQEYDELYHELIFSELQNLDFSQFNDAKKESWLQVLADNFQDTDAVPISSPPATPITLHPSQQNPPADPNVNNRSAFTLNWWVVSTFNTMGQAIGKVHLPDAPVDEKQTLEGAHPDFNGPVEKRKCTDVMFFILLVAIWICMTGLGADSCTHGSPWRLVAPTDSDGKICGHDEDVTDKSYLYFVGTDLRGACVTECPSETVNPDTVSDLICLPEVDASAVSVETALNSGLCQIQYESSPMFKYCIFADETRASLYDTSSLNGVGEEFGADIFTARGYIFGLGFALALIFGFSCTFLLRIPLALPFLVWGCIIGIGIAFLGTAAYMLSVADEWSNAEPQERENYEINFLKALGWIFIIFLILYICIIVFLRKRILLAMGVVKEACRAIAAMPLIALFPSLQLVGFILFMIPWTFYIVYTAGMGTISTYEDPTTGYMVREMSWSTEVKNRGWFFFFCFFWTTQFIIALGQIIVAMCFAKWYFLREPKNIGSRVILNCTWQGMCYHMGTAAFGSLILAAIKMVRMFLAKLQAQAGKANNKFMSTILCCLQCCLKCFENCVRFLNKNAYIQTAIFSYNFCTAAKHAFFLITRNIARVAAVGLLSEIIIFIGKLFIACFATFLTYCAITSALSDYLYSVVSPTIVTFCVTYVVASIFMTVFHMGIDTIFQCFCVDEEMFKEEPFASSTLQDYIANLPSHKDEKFSGREGTMV